MCHQITEECASTGLVEAQYSPMVAVRAGSFGIFMWAQSLFLYKIKQYMMPSASWWLSGWITYTQSDSVRSDSRIYSVIYSIFNQSLFPGCFTLFESTEIYKDSNSPCLSYQGSLMLKNMASLEKLFLATSISISFKCQIESLLRWALSWFVKKILMCAARLKTISCCLTGCDK